MVSALHARPSPALAPYIFGYVQRVSDPGMPQTVEPVVARAGSMLEFQFADQYDVPLYGVDLPNLSDSITIIGPIQSRFARIIIRGRIEALTVLFRPLGFYAAFGIPVARFAIGGTEGGAVLGAPVRALFEHLGNLRSFADRVEVLELFLTQRLSQSRSLHPAHRALRVLASADKHRLVSNIANQAGISTRQLERLSLDYCGISPVALARIARFQKALQLRQSVTQNWTWIAHAANYHDQMHMIRDFRGFAGDTPERAIGGISPSHLISFMCK